MSPQWVALLVFAQGPITTKTISAQSEMWSMVFGGDVMFNQIPVGQGSLKRLIPFFSGASAGFVNLEVPMTSAGSPTRRKSKAAVAKRSQFILHANPSHVQDLARLGLSAVSLANNHAMDYGSDGLASMMATLSSNGIRCAGAGATLNEASQYASLPAKSPRPAIAFYSALAFAGDKARWICTPATQTQPGVMTLPFASRPNLDYLKSWIAPAKQAGEFIIVAIHSGIERQPFPDSYQRQVAHALIDAGADVVFGCHPHVLEPVEIYEGKPILYSMGNLISPTSANAGLIKLVYLDRKLVAIKFEGYEIKNGVAIVPPPAQAEKFRASFQKLCKAFAKKVKTQPAQILPWTASILAKGR